MKGGAAGGGWSQVVPMTDINLHFTGDFAAIAAAHNLLAALVDNHVHHGNALGIDVRSVDWKRVLDLNDRALRDVVVGLGGPANGYPREDGLRHRGGLRADGDLLPHRVLGRPQAPDRRHRGGPHRDERPVTARDLEADGAMAVLLRDALAPNLVQTLEHTPAFVHGGPFANIAHGCSSVVATRAALRLADYVVTEAGFGADLGAEKFVDIKCRKSGLRPDAAVVVATVRALKFHGGVGVPDLDQEDLDAVERGMDNLARHLRNVREVFGDPVRRRAQPVPDRHRRGGGPGGRAGRRARGPRPTRPPTSSTVAPARPTWRRACSTCSRTPGPSTFSLTYPDELPLREKAETVARRLYGASRRHVGRPGPRGGSTACEAEGYGDLPVCIAKTQYSFSTDATLRGAPTGHDLHVREVRLCAGAGFVVLVCGDVMTMPGLPAAPAASRIDLLDDGTIVGLS